MLKPACVNALKRIFKLCDKNKDGLLDSAELNDFQVIYSPGSGVEITNEVCRVNALMHRCKLKSWKGSRRWFSAMVRGWLLTMA